MIPRVKSDVAMMTPERNVGRNNLGRELFMDQTLLSVPQFDTADLRLGLENNLKEAAI